VDVAGEVAQDLSRTPTWVASRRPPIPLSLLLTESGSADRRRRRGAHVCGGRRAFCREIPSTLLAPKTEIAGLAHGSSSSGPCPRLVCHTARISTTSA
jgi:hypothetical protein